MEGLYALALGYLLGSVPFGLILTNLFGEGNLRSIGSGNIGATNVLRTGSKGLAAATLLLDGAKGILALWLAGALWATQENGLSLVLLAGFGALVGHCFPAWLRFKGGKGVATMLGISLALDWRIGVASLLVWLGMAAWTRISSLSGMASALVSPLVAFWLFLSAKTPDTSHLGFPMRAIYLPIAVALLAMSVLVCFQHRANIRRLLSGTEPKIGQKS